jgi:rhodanese-related sulfurtransferase
MQDLSQDLLVFMQHHWQWMIVLVVILILVVALEFIKAQRNASRVTPAQAVHFMNRRGAIVIDTRPNDLFVSGHIIGAISIPAEQLAEKIKKHPKAKHQPLIFVCNNGIESAKSAAALQKQGYNIQILAGGITAWRDAQLPIVTGN